MVSKDKDLDQVLTDQVKLFDPMKGEFIGPAELESPKGYRPDQAVEVQTLCGDSTDNIPGVKGVGPKKAAALIAKYGTADDVIAHADELTPAMRKNVMAFADQIDVTRQLVTLRCDVPLDFDLERCRLTGVKPAILKPIFAELGFRRLADQMATEAGPDRPPSPGPRRAQARLARQPPAHTRAEPVRRRRRLRAPSAARADATKPLGPRPTGRQYVLVDNEAKLPDFLAELKQQPMLRLRHRDHQPQPGRRPAGRPELLVAGQHGLLPADPRRRRLPAARTDAGGPAADPGRPERAEVGQNIKYDLVVLKHATAWRWPASRSTP